MPTNPNPRLEAVTRWLDSTTLMRYEDLLAAIDAEDPLRQPPGDEAVEAMLDRMCPGWRSYLPPQQDRYRREGYHSLTAALAVMAGTEVKHSPLPEGSPAPPHLPWNRPELEGWSISGMNHYRQNGARHLFVSMTNAPLGISAEGPDEPAVWNELAASAAEATHAYNSPPVLNEPPPDDAEPDGMLAYALAMENPNRTDPNWPLPSFDARDWAKAFCEIAAKNGHPGVDEDWMISWFANALMRGFDERARQMAKETPEPPPPDPKPEWTVEQRGFLECLSKSVEMLLFNAGKNVDGTRLQQFKHAAFTKPEPVWPPEDCRWPKGHKCQHECTRTDCPHAGERADG